MTELETIVRALATVPEPARLIRNGRVVQCQLCGSMRQAEGIFRNRYACTGACPWLLATQWVAAHPEVVA